MKLAWAITLVALVPACVSTGPDRAVRERRAEAAARRGDWLRAGDLWYELFSDDPARDARPARETARALLAQGDAASARGILNAGLVHHPDDVELLVMSAESGEAAQAERHLERALARDPDHIPALVHLAQIHVADGRTESAIPLFRRAAKLSGAGALSLSAARAAADAGMFASAFADYRTGLWRSAAVEELLSAARLVDAEVVRAAEPAAVPVAITWLERVRALDPQNVEAHFRLGRLYREAGETAQAVDRARRAVEIDPTHVAALTLVAELYTEAGDAERARVFAERAGALAEE